MKNDETLSSSPSSSLPSGAPEGSETQRPKASSIIPSSSSDGFGPREQPDPAADPEALVRVKSGPVYSVFSKSMKRWIVGMIAVSSCISPMTANIYFPAMNAISHDLNVSVGLINLTLTTYMIFQGLSPTIFGDLGDMAGRRPAFIIAFSIYVAANIGLALQENYAALLALRCLQSAGSSGTLALGFAVVADITVPSERGKNMGFVSAGIQAGPALSPVLGGILSQYLGWRSIFWFCGMFAFVWLIPYSVFIPETSRKVVGNGSIPAQGWNMTAVAYVRQRRNPPPEGLVVQKRKLYLPNPFKTLRVVLEKDLRLILMYNSLLYVAFMSILATLSTEFARIYKLSEMQIGLCYLPYGVGCVAAAIAQGYMLDWNFRRIARKIGYAIDKKRGDNLSKFPIEKARIQLIVPFLVFGLAGVIGYGWALEREVMIAVPLVLIFFVGICINGAFALLNTLLVDGYPDAPATAVAANNLVRCSLGAVVTSLIAKMLNAFGRGWCFTFLSLVCVAFSPSLLALLRWGPGWREERRLRLQSKKEKAAQKGEK
ncbi:hypothetical protein MAPG_01625 [Magnaporthiopsis poae ATCC 64411]|uniref:Major facilitator superfamily (MFS) profile domain-containing protein n=1 Tax=Magnaporthiopsis poae (strain ATCC 64411 / 73-15) TaxID=644358 RepID=A0A0C4DP71_MAGP6|nr:hypothetical protein MAPG_01625 [Magnaporthiopsis poae ATCC 64411]